VWFDWAIFGQLAHALPLMGPVAWVHLANRRSVGEKSPADTEIGHLECFGPRAARTFTAAVKPAQMC